MKLYKALVTLTGEITKAKGEVFSVPLEHIEPLLKGGFIKEVKEETPQEKVTENEDKWNNRWDTFETL